MTARRRTATARLWHAARLLGAAALLGLVLLAPHWAMLPTQVAVWLGLQTPAAYTPRRSVPADGDNSEWPLLAQRPYLGNTAILASNGADTEWVWRDKLYDQRTNPGGWAETMDNWDIEQIRVIADSQYLFLYVEVDRGSAAWWDWIFQLNIAIDTEISVNPAGGASGMNWFGDESQSSLYSSAQYSEINLSADKNGVWVFLNGAANWYQAPNSSTGFNNAAGTMEVAIKWADIGIASLPPRLRLTMASAKRNCDDPNPAGQDKTADMSGCDMVDAVSWGLENTTEDWWDELSDGNIFTYIDLAFDANGNCANPRLPAAPQNLRAYDPVQDLVATSGETILTNNPLIIWDPVLPDGDVGDTIVGYYVQICTSAVVNADGFFHDGFWTVVAMNSGGAGPANRIVYMNNYMPQAWLGAADSTAGLANSNGYGVPILVPGYTYYIRVWARDRRGQLGAASQTLILPIDFPAWHDPYVFGVNSSTYRANRDPAAGSIVDFMLSVYDPPPLDPKDNYYVNPATGQTAPNEILNVILHIRKASGAWGTRILMGDEWKASDGDIAWYLPSVANPNLGNQKDPPDSYSVWRTGGDIDLAKSWLIKCTRVTLGNAGGAEIYKLNAAAGDAIEYYFELNCPDEAPGSNYFMSSSPRRFVHAYDANGITGYRVGTQAQAQARPLRFVVQQRDLPAVWHNPLSSEARLTAGGTPYPMRSPVWPETSPQTVRMSIGTIGTGSLDWRMVWRKGGGGWAEAAFPGGVLVDSASFLYYYPLDFNYEGGMIEYYFKTSDNRLYIFANGITDNAEIVYTNSLGAEGRETVPFAFPFTSRVRVTSTGSIGKDSHAMVAILNFRAPRFDAMNENALGVNGLLDLRGGSVSITGDVFTNAFPEVHMARSDSGGVAEPRRLFGRSREAIIAGVVNVVGGVRKAFFGPIFPFDYLVTDSASWNTGSDAYQNVPILTYREVFSDAVERQEAAGTTFGAGEPLEGVVYVPGDATIASLTVTSGALIATGKITVAAGAVVTAERLDLCSLGGDLRIAGRLDIETGVLFSNDAVLIETGARLTLSQLGAVVAQSLRIDSGATLDIVHPAGLDYVTMKESVLARATRWVVASLRELRR